MSFKRALVVDDSKSARMALKALLEQNGLIVDFAESGEDALEFLKSNAVDVIFMDHSMPGMTGLEAVSAIKADPKTAMIPVMMYTAKEGEVYVGQARALGAVGVLPKQVQPGVLFEMLLKLGLVKERRRNGRKRAKDAPRQRAGDAGEEDIDRQLERQALGMSVQALVSRILQDQHTELRSDILRSHHEFARRVAAEIFERQKAELAQAQAAAEKPPAPKPGYSGATVMVLAALLLVPTVVLLFHFLSVKAERDEALAANAGIAAAAEERLREARAQSSNLASNISAERQQSEDRYLGLLAALEWALNESGQVPYGELPFDAGRLDTLREVLGRLSDVGFRGTVRLDSYLGEFCLAQDGAGNFVLAPPGLSLDRCDMIGHPLGDSAVASDRQSVAFANFLATSPLVNGSGIDVEIVAHDRTDNVRRVQFPSGLRTAGEWNRVAARNNRVEFVLVPAPPGLQPALR